MGQIYNVVCLSNVRVITEDTKDIRIQYEQSCRLSLLHQVQVQGVGSCLNEKVPKTQQGRLLLDENINSLTEGN